MNSLILPLILFLSFSGDNAVYSRHSLKSQGDIEFFVDYSRFLRQDTMTYCEIYYLLNLKTVPYTMEYGEKVRRYSIDIAVTDEHGKQTFSHSNEIEKEKVVKRQFLVDLFKIMLKPGAYNIAITMRDSVKRKKGSVEFKLATLDYRERPLVSDITVGSYLDTAKTPFQKFGYSLYPMPSLAFSKKTDSIYLYAEVYHLQGDTGKYVMNYSILNNRGNYVVSIKPVIRDKKEPGYIYGSIALDKLVPGDYTLLLSVTDLATKKTSQSKREFLYFSESAYEDTAKLQSFYFFIDYFANSKQLSIYRHLKTYDDSLAFLKRFWKTKDPTPSTKINEFFIEYIKRAEYANEHFHEKNTDGMKTDRGRIYIKYGPPDEVKHSVFPLNYREKEIWFYHRGKELAFAFADIDGSGKMVLVYTNAEDEHSIPDWHKYISNEDFQ